MFEQQMLYSDLFENKIQVNSIPIATVIPIVAIANITVTQHYPCYYNTKCCFYYQY